MNNRTVSVAFRYALLALASLIIAAPLVWAVSASLRPANESFASGNVFFGTGATLENFRIVLTLAPFARYYVNSLAQVSLIIVFQVVFSSLAAYAFARWNFRGKNLLFGIILTQMMIPFAALLVGNFQLIGAFGLYDSILGIAMPFFGSAFGTFLLRQNFLSIPVDFADAAEIDGCNWAQVLVLVYVPNAAGSIASFVLSSVSWHWNDFLWPLIVTQSENVRPISTGLARFTQMGEIGAQWNLLAAATLLVVAPLILLFVVFREHFFASYLAAGIK